ncbi:unnamed protein product, partial [Rotaria magnacalcarata]
SVYSKLQQPSSPLSDLSIVISMEAVDEPPNNNDKDDQHRATSFFVLESSDFEDEHFDTDLHLQQQMLIDTINHQENDPAT